MKLPSSSLWDSVYLEAEIIRRSVFGRLMCWLSSRHKHLDPVKYTRIDHRAGPGAYADNFTGKCCANCGTILEEVQIL